MGMPRQPEDRVTDTVTELERSPCKVQGLNNRGGVSNAWRSYNTLWATESVSVHKRADEFDMEPLDKEASILHLIACRNLADPKQRDVEEEGEEQQEEGCTYEERQDAGVGWHLLSVLPAYQHLLELCEWAGISMLRTKEALHNAHGKFFRLLGVNSGGTLFQDHDESTKDLPVEEKKKIADEQRTQYEVDFAHALCEAERVARGTTEVGRVNRPDVALVRCATAVICAVSKLYPHYPFVTPHIPQNTSIHDIADALENQKLLSFYANNPNGFSDEEKGSIAVSKRDGVTHKYDKATGSPVLRITEKAMDMRKSALSVPGAASLALNMPQMVGTLSHEVAFLVQTILARAVVQDEHVPSSYVKHTRELLAQRVGAPLQYEDDAFRGTVDMVTREHVMQTIQQHKASSSGVALAALLAWLVCAKASGEHRTVLEHMAMACGAPCGCVDGATNARLLSWAVNAVASEDLATHLHNAGLTDLYERVTDKHKRQQYPVVHSPWTSLPPSLFRRACSQQEPPGEDVCYKCGNEEKAITFTAVCTQCGNDIGRKDSQFAFKLPDNGCSNLTEALRHGSVSALCSACALTPKKKELRKHLAKSSYIVRAPEASDGAVHCMQCSCKYHKRCIGVADKHEEQVICPLCSKDVPGVRDALPVRNDGTFVSSGTASFMTSAIRRAPSDGAVSNEHKELYEQEARTLAVREVGACDYTMEEGKHTHKRLFAILQEQHGIDVIVACMLAKENDAQQGVCASWASVGLLEASGLYDGGFHGKVVMQALRGYVEARQADDTFRYVCIWACGRQPGQDAYLLNANLAPNVPSSKLAQKYCRMLHPLVQDGVCEQHTSLSEFLSSTNGSDSCPCFVDDDATQEAYSVYTQKGQQAASKYIKQHYKGKDDDQNPLETIRVATLAQAREPVQWDRKQPWNQELLDPLSKQRQHMFTYNDPQTAGYSTSAFLRSV